jgi:hypothetical protein
MQNKAETMGEPIKSHWPCKGSTVSYQVIHSNMELLAKIFQLGYNKCVKHHPVIHINFFKESLKYSTSECAFVSPETFCFRKRLPIGVKIKRWST